MEPQNNVIHVPGWASDWVQTLPSVTHNHNVGSLPVAINQGPSSTSSFHVTINIQNGVSVARFNPVHSTRGARGQ